MERPSFPSGDFSSDSSLDSSGECVGGPEFCPVLPADGINNPPENMVHRLFINLAWVTGAIILLLVVLNFAATYLTPYIPFRWERALTGGDLLSGKLDARGRARQEELRRIAGRLVAAADLPEGMEVSVFYNGSGVKNAFATFGGNILVFDGLLDLVESEDGLAMVLAHEIMHIKHRDAVKGVVRALGLGLLALGMDGGGGYADMVVRLGVSGYSREQEEAADLGAVGVLGRVYGHVGGAGEFFRGLAERVEGRDVGGGGGGIGAVVSTHPDTLVRLRRVEEEAGRLGYGVVGELTPLAGVLGRGAVVIEEGRVDIGGGENSGKSGKK